MSGAPPPGATNSWEIFFPPGTRVVALPSWRQPRLLLPADTLRQRVSGSAFYPAFRFRGKVYRGLLRLRAVAAVGADRSAPDRPRLLTEFCHEVLPGARVRAVQVGIPGLNSKLTAQLVDDAGQVVAYLKCARSALARQRLRRERDLLGRLPAGAGPAALKFGSLGGCDLLLLAAVSGRALRATADPPDDLRRFCASLLGPASFSVSDHPWVQSQSHDSRAFDRLLAPLVGRRWPVAIQHGDLAPWNMIRTAGPGLTAIDWEYGSACGFPGLDLAQYLLQVAVLIKRAAPAEGCAHAVRQLLRDEQLAVTAEEAAALVGLAACLAYQNGAADGHPPGFWVQAWRRAVWTRCEG